jgi:hypothetical protein
MKKRTIIIVSAIGLLILFIPLLAYLITFSGHSIGEDPQYWGFFGDYFGGVLNPIIALISTGLLIYISVIVGKNSVAENSKLFFTERMTDAYDKISSLWTDVVNESTVFDRLYLLNERPDKTEEDGRRFNEEKLVMAMKFSKLNTCISLFSVKYSHLFNYDTTSEAFSNLIEFFNSYCEKLDKAIAGEIIPEEEWNEFDERFHLFNSFLEALQKEILEVKMFKEV